MMRTDTVRKILSWYEGETPGLKTNLSRLLMHGRLAGTGRVVILPVDQGFEHGPARSFAPNPVAYDPHYLYNLAIESGVSGYAAPLGLLEQGADTFAGEVPLILKLNSGNSLVNKQDQALTGTVEDALRLGCVGVGFTIYPGADDSYDMMEELREITLQAKSRGLMTVVWSYPRGGKVTKEGETGLDIIAYAAHMAALLGATIIKVKLPTASATSCRHPSPASASSCSRAVPPRPRTSFWTRFARSATAAETAQSSAATPSSARRKRR
jgi:fructose-bisphosphate aldolase, class I